MKIPGPVSHPPPNESQRTMDDEIRRVEEYLRDLKSQRNARAEISKLPVEVLLEIFKIVRASDWPPSFWMKITFVCRHWRNAALRAYTLWASPPTHHLDLTLILLERSRNCDIDIIFTKRTDPRTIEAILCTDNHLKRIRTLEISELEGPAIANIQNIVKTRGGSQRLQKLAVTYKGGHPNDFTFSASAFEPLDQLLGLSLSALRCDWDFPPLPNLTQLDLGSGVRFTGPVSLNKLLECLCGMPALQTLRLFLMAFGNDIPQTMTEKLVELPRLTVLRLYGISNCLEYLLSHLTLSQLESLSITCIHMAAQRSDCHALTKALSKKLMSGNFGTLDGLMIRGQGHLLMLAQNKADPSLDFRLPQTDDVGDWVYLLKDAIMQINETVREGIQSLTVESNSSLSNNDFPLLILFGHLRSLTMIKVDSSTLAAALIHSLSIPGDLPDVATPVPFPKLFGIHFSYTKLSPTLLQTLQTNLQQRSAVGASIRSVEFQRTKNTKRELSILKDIIPVVIIT